MTPAATIDIHRNRRHTIDPMIYGHFLESAFFGNIEGGVFDEGSPLAYGGDDTRNGLRTDVIELCRELGLPVVRWPGGNFTSAYHWEDGIGPRDSRPRRLELAWGSEESNRFGTDEFLAWCAEVGTEPYLAHSCRERRRGGPLGRVHQLRRRHRVHPAASAQRPSRRRTA